MKLKRTRSRIIISLVVIFLIAILIENTYAIPPFARKYKTSCTTCHVSITKRNLAGEAFRRNGYVVPKNEKSWINEEPVKLGAEQWKKVWPEAVWPGLLPAAFPFGAFAQMRVNGNIAHNVYYANNDHNSKFTHIEFDMPADFQFVFGGNFGDDISFFGKYAFINNEAYSDGLKRLFIQFNDVVGPDNLFNIRVGKFETGITDGYTSNHRLTLSYPIIHSYSPAGLWKMASPQIGIEFNGIIDKKFYYAAGVVNGPNYHTGDSSDDKDFYARLSYIFSEHTFTGDEFFTKSGSALPEDPYISAGVYSYMGNKAELWEGDVGFYSDFYRIGMDLNVDFSKLSLIGGISVGENKNTFNNNQIFKNSIYFAEANYSYYPWLIFVFRYENVNSWIDKNDVDRYMNLIPNITILYRANIRFSIEAYLTFTQDRTVNNYTIPADNNEVLQWVKLNTLFAF